MRDKRRHGEADRFEHERRLLAQGFRVIAGVDEAGRGPLAGPVVAAAVVFPVGWISGGLPEGYAGLNDSKQLSEARREAFYEALMNDEQVVRSVVMCDAGVIDSINILQATHRAMGEALEGLPVPVDHALVDGRPVKSLSVQHTALVKGDSLSFSIAAASVLAKVTRDREMQLWHERYPRYGFDEHKGYGTAKHLAALRQWGPCPIHRMTFAPLKAEQGELF